MDVLFTGFALLACGACVFLVWQAHGFAEQARAAADALRKSQGTVQAHTLAIENLHVQLRRANGRISAMKPPRLVDDDNPTAFTTDDLPPANGALDPELAAELALQNAPAVAPGS